MSGTRAVEETVRDEERRLRQIQDREEAVLIHGQTGEVIWRKRGEAMRVGFELVEVRQMAGNILTHNHPVSELLPADDPRGAGSSISPADVGLLAEAGLAELRAVSRRYTYLLKPPDAEDMSPGAQAYRRFIEPAGYDRVMTVVREFSEQIRQAQQRHIDDPANQLTRLQAEAIHYHLMMIELATSWGLRYERTEVRD